MAFAAESQLLAANASSFASLSDLDSRTALSDRTQLERWRIASDKLNADPALKLHFDFQDNETARSLRNHTSLGEDGSIVGAAWTTGRWPGKGALEFRNISDRVRLSAPGEVKALTMAMWVRISGLDRYFNSLFMSEGWSDRKVRWRSFAMGKSVSASPVRPASVIRIATPRSSSPPSASAAGRISLSPSIHRRGIQPNVYRIEHL